jgi:hypothetical protein
VETQKIREEQLMNKLVVKLPLILGVVAAIALATTPSSWAAAKKAKKVAAATPAPAASVPGSEFLKPPPKVDPIFPYTPPPPSKKK